jgi:hypothetical protein
MLRKEATLDPPINNGMRVANKRNGIRLDCDYKCLLQHDDIMYLCEMNNISISGALVSALEVIPFNIQLGDSCNLLLSSDHTLSSGEYKGKVTRLEHPKIALHFIDIGF